VDRPDIFAGVAMTATIALCVALCVLSAVLTRFVHGVSARFHLLDMPNERSSHTRPVPRTGGIAIAIVLLGGIALLAAMDALAPQLARAIVPAGVALVAVGVVDDLRGVPAWARLLVHVASVGWFLAMIGGAPDFGIAWLQRSDVVRWSVTFIGLVWLLNLFNFMDGIDGLAASEAVFTPLGMVALASLHKVSGHALTLPLIVAAVPLGFLRWNWPPARVFMGDAGSGLLGFMMGAMIVIADHELGLSWAVSVILLGVFIIDATTTLICRMFRGDKWYSAHRSHAYQHLSRRLKSHKAATSLLLLVNVLWLLPLAYAAAEWPRWSVVFVAVALAPLVGAALWLGAGRRDDA
jgi:Fuc2NAc and GlcNAc transferase